MAASLLHSLHSSAASCSSPMLGIEDGTQLNSHLTAELHLSPTDVDSSISLHGPECQYCPKLTV